MSEIPVGKSRLCELIDLVQFRHFRGNAFAAHGGRFDDLDDKGCQLSNYHRRPARCLQKRTHSIDGPESSNSTNGVGCCLLKGQGCDAMQPM